jgi:tetratricopeptide (TPR) repeat protein
MNFTTQAAQDVIGKIQRDPAEIRHWRQLLIVCFDQKAIETLQTLQVVVAAIEQIWAQQKQKAKEVHDAALKKQRATGKKDTLPSLAVLTIPLTGRQKESFGRLAANPESVPFIYRFGLHIEEDFDLPAAAYPIYERAQALDTDETQLEQKISEALKRIKAKDRAAGAQTTGSIGALGTIAPESMGVKSPTHHRPSAAALIKRTGRLTVDRGKIQASTPTEVPWAETQKKLDEMMSRLVVQAATLCETAPRPMRLPRSIAPSQWLEFLEGHITLLVATLEAQDLFVETTVNLEEISREDLGARADLVYALMEEIERGLASLAPRRTMPIRVPAAKPAPTATTIEDIFDSIEGGALAEAETTLRSLGDESHPKDQLSEVWFHLGLAYQNNHDSKLAVGAYQRARELNPQNLQAWFNGGMIQHEEGMLRDALACYRRALEIDPEQSKIWCNLGAVQFQLGEFDESVESLNRAVTLKPDYARAWDNLAGSLCAVEAMDEAEICCHRAMEHKPRYADAAFKLGAICFQQNRLEEAEDAFRKALEWQPGYPLAGHYLAMVLARGQQLDEAMEVCEKAAAPQGETELPSQAWVEVAFQLYDQGKFAEALHAYEQALIFTPERAVIWLDAGVAFHQMGELDEAQKHYEQAVSLDPELARAWHNLGAVREELGDEEGGRTAVEEAERLLARGR